MSDLRKAAEMALEALEEAQYCVRTNYHPGHYWEDEIEALRQALAQPEQEPVAWGLPNLQDPIRRKQALLRVDLKIPDGAQFPQFWVPLYTAPPKREWVGLTDEDLTFCLPGAARIPPGWRQTAQAIEAKLKEKNT